MIGITENTIASERYNAVELLRSISTHIRGVAADAPRLRKAVGLTLTVLATLLMQLVSSWACDHSKLLSA